MAVPALNEGTIQLNLRDLSNGNDEIKVVSEPMTLGCVKWIAEVKVIRQTYSNPNFHTQRLYVWYHYRLCVSCVLPDDTKYFNCNAEIEHCRYWVKDNDDLKKGHNLVDRLTHRYTQDSKSLIFCVIVDPGCGDDPAVDRTMKVDLKVRLVDPIPPVLSKRVDFGDSPWHDLDVLCDRQKKIRTSKSILAIVSPFFRALLYGDFKEKGVDYVQLPNVNGEEFLELLRYLYPNCRKPITENNVETLLFMADRFLMETVSDDCEKFLLFCKDEQVSLDDKTLLADLYRLPRLKQQCSVDLASKLNKCSLKEEK